VLRILVPVTGSQKVAPRCSKTVQTHTSLSRRTACCAASLLTTSLCIAQDAVYCYRCSVVIGATAPWIRGTRPLQLLRVIFSLGNVGSKPDLLAKLTGRSKEDKGRKWVKHGCSDNGRRGEGRRRKIRGLTSTAGRGATTFSKLGGPISWSGVLLPLSKKIWKCSLSQSVTPTRPLPKSYVKSWGGLSKFLGVRTAPPTPPVVASMTPGEVP